MASRAPSAPRGVARFLAKPRGKPAGKAAAVAATSETAPAAEASKAAPALKIPELLAELEEHFKQLSVRLTYEALGGELGSGGLCKVKGLFRIIIDKRTTASERVAMLLPLLLRFAGDDLTVSPTLRDLLARLRPPPAHESEAEAIVAETEAAEDVAADPSLADAGEEDVALHIEPALLPATPPTDEPAGSGAADAIDPSLRHSA